MFFFPFDVVSFFTLVPVDVAVEVAQRRLHKCNDKTLSDRTSLNVYGVYSWTLKLLSECNVPIIQSRVYQQMFGTLMGSPVSVMFASLVMDDANRGP